MMRALPRKGRLAALLISSALLAGCAEMNLFGHYAKRVTGDGAPPTNTTTSPNYKIGKPYQVGGVWYYPREDYDYDETGIASWYGPNFHEKLTANGEIFDQNAVSAAHKTLPLPSVVRVTNLDNGRSLVVRVNDRGPFVNGRIIDLSRRAGQLLGIENTGTARVRVQIMPEESRAIAGKVRQPDEPQVAAAPRAAVTSESLPSPNGKEAPRNTPLPTAKVGSGGGMAQRQAESLARAERVLASQEVTAVPVVPTNIFVQAGSFSRYDNAMRLQARLSAIGRPQVQQVNMKGQSMYRVRLGPVATVEEADRLLDAVVAAGQQDARVIVD